jgi:hypothetical protein
VSEAKNVLEQAIDRWNASDRDGWAALYADDVVYEGPGGARISGLEDLKEKYFDALAIAAPDRASRDVVLLTEGDHGRSASTSIKSTSSRSSDSCREQGRVKPHSAE